MNMMKNEQKIAAMAKLGTPVVAYGRVKNAVVLKQIDEDHFLVSMGDSGVNWTERVHIDQIELGGALRKVSTKGMVFEKEDEGCEGGACKL